MQVTDIVVQRWFLGVTFLFLVACSSSPGNDSMENSDENIAQTDVAQYSCQNDSLFVYFHGDKAELDWQGETYLLTQAVSASGSYFLGEDISFWAKGTEAGLEVDDMSSVSCTLVKVSS